MYALVDGNNFYVSCERVFRPSLVGQPVVVLSNNDGCAISRSNEAKAIGVRMGHPWFQCRELESEQGLIALSANFALYADMSDRMMAVAAAFTPKQEIYSIDESFLDFSGVPGDLVARCVEMRTRILEWVGIPCGVGLGPTKTLAKLGNFIAKTAERKPGSYPMELAQVCHLGAMSTAELEAVMAATEVGEVWGIGRRIGAQLVEAGVKTVLDLVHLDPMTVRRRFSVVLEKTVRELQGTPCIELESEPPPKQQIMCSRSFGRSITLEYDLVTAITEFTSRAAEKLRAQSSAAGALVVFIRTSPFRKYDAQYSASTTVPTIRPTADTTELVAAALTGLRQIYRSGFQYAKAGVMLIDLQPQGQVQGELDLCLDDGNTDEKSVKARDKTKLMAAVDTVNCRFGRGSLILASAGLEGDKRPWAMKQERRTPNYTTEWSEVPIVRA